MSYCDTDHCTAAAIRAVLVDAGNGIDYLCGTCANERFGSDSGVDGLIRVGLYEEGPYTVEAHG
jgi:hypothetical protein